MSTPELEGQEPEVERLAGRATGPGAPSAARSSWTGSPPARPARVSATSRPAPGSVVADPPRERRREGGTVEGQLPVGDDAVAERLDRAGAALEVADPAGSPASDATPRPRRRSRRARRIAPTPWKSMSTPPRSKSTSSIAPTDLTLGGHCRRSLQDEPMDERFEVQRTIPADPATIFDVVRSPAGHVAIDASGMLQAAAASPPGRRGHVRDPHGPRALGDLPIGKYDVTVTITAYEQDAYITWEVSGPGFPSIGHYYGYRLEPSTAAPS